MGAGRKVWTNETLSVADLQNYLQDQTVMCFATTAARTAAIPSPVDGMVTYLEDVDRLELRRDGAWVVVSGAVTPTALTMTSAAVNFSDGAPGNIQVARYWLQNRTVFMSGLLRLTAAAVNGSETSVATVPAGFRPKSREMFPQVAGTSPARLDVYSTGDVRLVALAGYGINTTFTIAAHWSLD